MLRCSSRHGCGHSRTMLIGGLTPGSVLVGESEPVNKEVVESLTHELHNRQQEMSRILNNHSIGWLRL